MFNPQLEPSNLSYSRPSCRVVCSCEARRDEAEALSRRLNCSLNQPDHDAAVVVEASNDRWSLIFNHSSPMWVDLNQPQGRQASRSWAQDPLIKACKPRSDMHLVDLTAGFGRDAACLFASGMKHLTLVEQDPIMQVLLRDGIRRAYYEPDRTLELIPMDCLSYLQSLTPEAYPDVIYYDPMHPARTKSAKVKKWMQCLQSWIEPNQNNSEVIQLAQQRVRERVVVKWPSQLKPPIQGWNYVVKTKLIQLIVYLA
jgi:16S rRNA (guanine1516-N2)-methyltransferase